MREERSNTGEFVIEVLGSGACFGMGLVVFVLPVVGDGVCVQWYGGQW